MNAPYAQGTDLLQRYDARIIGDLVGDAGTRNLAPATDQNVITALTDAASQILSSCYYGQRYTAKELAGLAGADRGLLYRLNCDLAFLYLANRRAAFQDSAFYKDAYERSKSLLDALRNGELVFGVAGDMAVGVPSNQFPSSQTIASVNLLRDRAFRFFPLRPQQKGSY